MPDKLITLCTPDADELHDPDQERIHGPSHRLEHYLNDNGTAQLYCTTQEREAFEQQHSIAIDSDVLTPWLFRRFISFLSDNYTIKAQ